MAYGVKDLATATNGTDNVAKYVFSNMADPSWDYSRMAPAAFSVQIMNSEAVQTSSGITYYIGRIKTIPGFDADLTLTGKGFGDNFIACNCPRLCSAAKIAFRGVQVNAVPYNMSALAQFNGREKITETSAATLTKDDPIPAGFGLICVVNEGKINLQYLVCCEWRVRFDPSNPAQATHTHHPPSSEATWSGAMRSMANFGSGAVDIAEVAERGMAMAGSLGML